LSILQIVGDEAETKKKQPVRLAIGLTSLLTQLYIDGLRGVIKKFSA